ncbi:hypothetical protein [Breoghania sp.]|uniref:hypothetical protein n=1 Tax=Breoghania sp. TaxID=2065378 RepID=UPI002AA6A02E|nr:hypothetical protein [Breoghania sp.]
MSSIKENCAKDPGKRWRIVNAPPDKANIAWLAYSAKRASIPGKHTTAGHAKDCAGLTRHRQRQDQDTRTQDQDTAVTFTAIGRVFFSAT